MMRPALVPAALLAVALAAAPAAGQDWMAALSAAYDDWNAAAGATPADSASLARDGICPRLATRGADWFRRVDLDGDGRPDLLYSGYALTCDGGEEATHTAIRLRRGAALDSVFEAPGHIVQLTRNGTWAPASFVAREDGCCGGDGQRLTHYAPVVEGGRVTWRATARLRTSDALVLPEASWATPRAVTVGAAGAAVRIAPSAAATRDLETGERANVLATAAPGTPAVAYAEATDDAGTAWWLVLVSAPAEGRDDAARLERLLGWVRRADVVSAP